MPAFPKISPPLPPSAWRWVFLCIKSSYSIQAQALNLAQFQEVPTGYEAANHNEIVGEELVDVTQEVEQEAFAMSRPEREVRDQLRLYV